MKIGPEHVGKLVRGSGWGECSQPVRVKAVSDQYFIAESIAVSEETPILNGEGWILVEEPKKPSDRVKELFEQFAPGAPYGLVAFEMALLKYLDEQAEKAPR